MTHWQGGAVHDMTENHIIPVSNGLFEHKDRIGPAIWEFLWCIDRISDEEIDVKGERWGIILNGIPIKHERIADELGTCVRTVKRNLARLKQEKYITTVRTARGEIIRVRNNKKDVKKGDKNVPSQLSEGTKVAHHTSTEGTEMSLHDEKGDKNVPSSQSDGTKMSLLKDFIKILIDRLIDGLDDPRLTERCGILLTVLAGPMEEIHLDEKTIADRIVQIETHFNNRKGRMHSAGADWVPVNSVAKMAIPMEFILFGIDLAFARHEKAKRWEGDEIKSFSYCVKTIESTWHQLMFEMKQSETTPVPSGSVSSGPSRKTKQQRELDELRKKREEAIRLEPSGSY